MTALLNVRDLSKAFGRIVVADSIAFSVAENEILGIIGPNGAGKTTLFEMLSGHLLPSTGQIHFLGEDITGLAPHERARLGIARTYQVPRPFGQMSVVDNLLVAASFAGGLSRAQALKWIDEVLVITGLRPHAHTLAGRLPLLLIDEVAAGLTQEEVSEFIALVFRIRGIGTAIIWIEHVIRTMLTATDRLIVLAGGEVLANGDPRRVIEQPEVKRVYLGG
jgi:branched-chain amino acid transport system ATP-binding protein